MRALVKIWLLSFLIAFPASAGEGFGWVKVTANLQRVHPPKVLITGKHIAVRASSQSPQGQAAATRLKAQLESQLLSNDSRLSADDGKPETIIDLVVLQDEMTERWENRRGKQQYDTGNRDSKGRKIYDWRDVTLQYKIVHYSFSLTYKVFEPRSGRSLTADTVNHTFQNEYQDGNGAPDQSTAETGAINVATATIAAALTPTKETVGVLLPKGSFESAAAFATAGLWSKYLEALEKMPSRPNPADEAYHQYAMGVAYEAMGYGAEDPETTLKYLEQASVHYNNAIDANPKEGYFRQGYESVLNPLSKQTASAPLDRVQGALKQYQTIKQFADAGTVADGGTPGGSKGDLGGGAITNASVIDMIKAGVPEEAIITSIKSAPNTAFDVSPKGLIQLAQANVSKKLIQQIQAANAGGGGNADSKSDKSGTKSPKTTATKKKSS